MPLADDGTRLRVLDLVTRHGFNATAFQTLDDGYRYAFLGDDACVAYVDTGGAWVVAGAPIAPPDRIASTALEFAELARSAGKRCAFFATEERFVSLTESALRALRLGEQPVWDPHDWADILAGHRSLREQLRRARAKQISTREVTAAELESGPVRQAVTRLAERWFASRKMAPMGFLVQVEPFRFVEYRRCFVAERDGQVIAFAGLVPVPAREGWFLEHLLRAPDAPNGTAELLVDTVMRWAAAAGSRWLTLGLAPLAGDVPAALRAARRSTALLYDFAGLRAYKAKLRPELWAPLYLSYPRTQGMAASLFDVLAAFSNGGLFRFAVRSLLRGSSAVIRVLAVLLVPWTLLLALAPRARFFGAAWIQWAWVAFDVLLTLALVRTLQKPSTRILAWLAAAVSCDAVLTTVEAAVWNVPRVRGVVDAMVIVVACAAPSLAAAVLWGARRNRLQAR